jgi:fucose 4-O-acetylase-like acetyltransferase
MVNESMSNIIKTGRIAWADYVKGICIFCVYIHHSGDKPYGSFFSPFFLISFFFISGYFYSKCTKDNYLKKLQKIFKSIMFPFVVFSLIAVFSKVETYKSMIAGDYSVILERLIDILKGRVGWFLPCLAIGEAIFGLTLLIGRNKNKFIIISNIIILLIGIALPLFGIKNCYWYIDVSLVSTFYICLGYFYRNYEKKIEVLFQYKYFIFALISYLFLLILNLKYWNLKWSMPSNYYDCFFYFLIVSLIGIFLILFFCKKTNHVSIVCYMGENSLVYYLINGFCVNFSIKIINMVPLAFPDFLQTLFVAVVACLIATPISYIIKRYFSVFLGKF